MGKRDDVLRRLNNKLLLAKFRKQGQILNQTFNQSISQDIDLANSNTSNFKLTRHTSVVLSQ